MTISNYMKSTSSGMSSWDKWILWIPPQHSQPDGPMDLCLLTNDVDSDAKALAEALQVGSSNPAHSQIPKDSIGYPETVMLVYNCMILYVVQPCIRRMHIVWSICFCFDMFRFETQADQLFTTPWQHRPAWQGLQIVPSRHGGMILGPWRAGI